MAQPILQFPWYILVTICTHKATSKCINNFWSPGKFLYGGRYKVIQLNDFIFYVYNYEPMVRQKIHLKTFMLQTPQFWFISDWQGYKITNPHNSVPLQYSQLPLPSHNKITQFNYFQFGVNAIFVITVWIRLSTVPPTPMITITSY